jgi:hypothetical protein
MSCLEPYTEAYGSSYTPKTLSGNDEGCYPGHEGGCQSNTEGFHWGGRGWRGGYGWRGGWRGWRGGWGGYPWYNPTPLVYDNPVYLADSAPQQPAPEQTTMGMNTNQLLALGGLAIAGVAVVTYINKKNA